MSSSADGQPDLTVVVPAYNEADTIAQVRAFLPT